MSDDQQRQIDELRTEVAKLRRLLDQVIKDPTRSTTMTTGDVAKRFSVGKRTVIQAIEQGNLPASRRKCPGGWGYVVRFADANRLFGIKGKKL